MGGAEILELTARLTEIDGALARAHDPQTFLRAVAGALAPFGPDHIDLVYVDVDGDGVPESAQVVDSWQDGASAANSPIVGARYRVADFPVAQVMLRSHEAPMLLPDIAVEPPIATVMHAIGRTLASSVILPLFSARAETWQGALGLFWRARHEPDAAEQALYRLLMRMFSEALAAKRTQRALRDSLQRNEALLQRTEATLRETEAQKTTLRVLLDNLPLGVGVVHGRTGQRELTNRRGVALLGDHGDAGEQIAATQPFVYFPGEDTPAAMERLPHAVTLATEETQTAELEFERAAGERALIEVTTTLLRYPGDPEPRVILLYQDITEVRRRELDRLRTQDALLQAQTLALAERSTPLLPIRDDVLVMPIIGTIDAARGRQIVDTLVHLGGRTRVRAAIVDVTGVRELDGSAASTLADAAHALRLRGVRPILTGIQPAVAATLVELGVDLSGIRVCTTLQDAVARASAG